MTALFDWLDWAMEAYALQLVAGFALAMTVWALWGHRKLEHAEDECAYWRKWAEFYHDRYEAMTYNEREPAETFSPRPRDDYCIDLQDAYCYEVNLHLPAARQSRALRHQMPTTPGIPVCHIEMDGHRINTINFN